MFLQLVYDWYIIDESREPLAMYEASIDDEDIPRVFPHLGIGERSGS